MTPDPHVLVSARVYDAQVGGNTRYVRSIYERLPEYGVGFSLARPTRYIRPGRIRSAAYAGLESAVWPIAPPGKPTAIHFPADTGAVVRSRVPVVGTIHGLATLHMSGVRSPHADALWRARVRRLAKVSDRIVTVSESSAADIAAFEPHSAGRITVIPHGIDHVRFNTQTKTDFSTVRRRLAIPDTFFLYVGNLDPRKNVVELAKAAATTYRATKIPLVISGAAAWDSEDILSAVRSTEGVIYVGRTSDEDMIALLQHALAFCFPSTYEGFGFPVLEAMACGAPVICSDRGSLKEVAAGASWTLGSIDSASIADAMIDLARDSNECNRLSELGLANAARYRWEDSARMHSDVFKEVSR